MPHRDHLTDIYLLNSTHLVSLCELAYLCLAIPALVLAFAVKVRTSIEYRRKHLIFPFSVHLFMRKCL